MSAIDNLVEESVRCAMLIKSKKCSPVQCETCPVRLRIEGCMNSLNDWERLEVSTRARRSLEDSTCSKTGNIVWKSFCKFGAALFLLFVIFCLFKACTVSAEEYPKYVHYDYYVNDEKIRDCLNNTYKNVHDRDGDGKVNCIDYAMTFKKEWNKKYPPAQCEIVRNYHKGAFNRTIMNHLFVRVRITPTGKWLYIEPQAKSFKRNYCMSDFWGYPRYDPTYNVYGETFVWMCQCKY